MKLYLVNIAAMGSFLFTASAGYAADVVLDNTSSVTTAAAGDNVTVPDHAGADGNTTNEWIKPDGDDVIVTIEGTLQGGSFLVRPTQDMDNLTINVGENGAAVAKGTRAFDIDGTGRTLTNGRTIWAEGSQDMDFTNSGTISSITPYS